MKQNTLEHLTTGAAARYCGVRYVTVLRWIQKGYLPAFRLPSGHYRVARTDFNEFLQRHNIPIENS
jgi:two-component system response regulator VicR